MELVFMYCAIIVCASTRSIFTKQNGIIGGSASLFNFTRALSALILFSAMSVFGGFSLHYPTFIYGTAYGVLFFCSCCCGCNAMARGPLGITSSLVAFSLVIPCLFGVFFLKEKINGFDITGFALIIVAIILMNRRVKAVRERETYVKTETEKDPSNNTGYKQGWGFYVAATILSDGISATIKKLHQVKYPGAYCKEFMCFGMFFGMLLFIALIVKNKNNIRESGKERKKKSILYGSVGGIANGLYNYLILVLAGLEGATALFPIISVSTIAASELSGRAIFKERLNAFQIVGIVLAMVAIFFIKI